MIMTEEIALTPTTQRRFRNRVLKSAGKEKKLGKKRESNSLGGGGGGFHIKVYTGRLYFEIQLHALVCYFQRKGTSFL